MLVKFIVCVVAGLGAGIGTGLAGLSAAVISPMLITFLGFPAYQAVAISLASDVLASAASAYTYGKNRNLDIRNGLVMLAAVLVFTLIGSWAASLVPNATMGGFSVFMTLLLGIKFIVRPVMTTKESSAHKSRGRRIAESLACGSVVGFICGFIGAGGGMMMGTSVFIMTFTAFTGAVSHVAIGGGLDVFALTVCVVVTLLGARIAAVFANRASAKALNRVTGVVLTILGAVMVVVNLLS